MSSNYLNELNDKQLEAVMHEGSPLLVLAGAGSGKTKTLTYRAARMIDEKKVSGESLLLVTFTNKAAGEMKERISQIVDSYLPHVGTFHSISARILRKDGHNIGIGRDFIIYDAQDQVALVKEIVKELDIDNKRFRPRSLLGGISSAKQEMVDQEDYQRMAKGPYQEVVAEVYSEYQKRLKKYGALDFDDLLLNAVKLMEKAKARERYRELFSEVMVDEYQDTNAVQYRLIKLLTKGKDNLAVVGDASQSIYRWRGADYRNIERLKKDYQDLVEVRLERNYRSTQNILNAADQVIANNKSHPILSLWTDTGDGEKIGLMESYSGKDEARNVIREIEKLKGSKGYDWNDFAVLYRTNAQSRLFEEAFIRAGIPYVLVGGVKFYERAEVKDVLAYLRLVHNPEDGVSKTRAEKRGKRRLAKLMDKIHEDERYKEKTVSQILSMIYQATGYLERYDEEVEEDLARLENIRELDSLAEEFSELGEFLENVALVQAEYYAGEMGREKKAVTLMTMHAAKGLEYPVVFVVGMEEGLFPHSRSMMEKEELEEERRLCYVGITRAKEKLYLSYAKGRVIYGSHSNNMRSRFIDEVDKGLFENIGVRNVRRSVGRRNFGKNKAATPKQAKIKIDSLSDDTLEAFLDGEISVEELLR